MTTEAQHRANVEQKLKEIVKVLEALNENLVAIGRILKEVLPKVGESLGDIPRLAGGDPTIYHGTQPEKIQAIHDAFSQATPMTNYNHQIRPNGEYDIYVLDSQGIRHVVGKAEQKESRVIVTASNNLPNAAYSVLLGENPDEAFIDFPDTQVRIPFNRPEGMTLNLDDQPMRFRDDH